MTILIKLNHIYFGVAQVNPSMQNMANYDKYSDKPKKGTIQTFQESILVRVKKYMSTRSQFAANAVSDLRHWT